MPEQFEAMASVLDTISRAVDAVKAKRVPFVEELSEIPDPAVAVFSAPHKGRGRGRRPRSPLR
jgi:hypothetical protein